MSANAWKYFEKDLFSIYQSASDKQKEILDSYAIAACAWAISEAQGLSRQQCSGIRSAYALRVADAVKLDLLEDYLRNLGIENSSRIFAGMDKGMEILFDD